MSRMTVQGYEVEYEEEPLRTVKKTYTVDYKPNKRAGEPHRVKTKTLLREEVVKVVRPKPAEDPALATPVAEAGSPITDDLQAQPTSAAAPTQPREGTQ